MPFVWFPPATLLIPLNLCGFPTSKINFLHEDLKLLCEITASNHTLFPLLTYNTGKCSFFFNSIFSYRILLKLSVFPIIILLYFYA